MSGWRLREGLSQGWREAHCEAGDESLATARGIIEQSSGARGDQVLVLAAQASAIAAIAQAHYAAANVRARPAQAS